MDDDVVAGHPVDRGGDLVLVTSLERVDNAEHLGRVAAGRGGVGEDGADRLLGVDDEDGADGEGNALGVNIGNVLVVKPALAVSPLSRASACSSCDSHVVGVGNLAFLVADDGEGEVAAGDLVDVGDPATVALNGVGREANQLDATLGELGLELGESTELGGADGSVVLGVGEQNDPLVTNELVEVNGTLGGLSLEVGGNAAQAKRLGTLLSGHCDGSAGCWRQRYRMADGGLMEYLRVRELRVGRVELRVDEEAESDWGSKSMERGVFVRTHTRRRGNRWVVV